MSPLERILKRRRDADEAELDDLRRVVMARLATTNGHAADPLPAADRGAVVVRRIDGGMAGGVAHSAVRAEPQAPSPWLLVAPLDTDPPTAPFEYEFGRPVSVAGPANGAHAASEPGTEAPMFEDEVPAQADVDVLYETLAAGEAQDAARFDVLITPEDPMITADPQPEAVDAEEPMSRPQPRQRRRPGRAAAKELRRASPRSEMTSVVYCPYCAVPLERVPEADDRCPRCGQLMIVRSVGARAAILAEAVLPFFQAERDNEERWTRDRDRWLDLARESGAGKAQGPDLAGELISEADVAAARAWYMSSLDRAFRVAEKDRRWEEAAWIRYEQAGILSALTGSSEPPSAEVVRLHRDGIAADLQAIGEVASSAEVRGASCCEACRTDDHRVVEIAEELRSPTLPHGGCPDGLCRCRWFLTTRDQELLAALLRRQIGAERRTGDAIDDPRDDAMSAIA